jgi:catechol 2,3-dioxygenase-like lactoylglutathione lyase family enzyme
MPNLKFSHFFLVVPDQDAALDFYTNKLGLEMRADIDLGEMRWLTVFSPEQPDVEVVLIDADVRPDIAADIRDLLARGGMNGAILTTTDVRADYERLSAAGVEFIGEPEEHFYGIDVGFRDPFGNQFRLTQPAENPVYPEGAVVNS